MLLALTKKKKIQRKNIFYFVFVMRASLVTLPFRLDLLIVPLDAERSRGRKKGVERKLRVSEFC